MYICRHTYATAQQNEFVNDVHNVQIHWTKKKKTIMNWIYLSNITFEDSECCFGWNSIADPIFRDAFVWSIITTSSHRFNAKYWLAIYLVHRISTLRSRYLFTIFAPDYRWNRITTGCTEKACNTANSYRLINRSLRNFRGIYNEKGYNNCVNIFSILRIDFNRKHYRLAVIGIDNSTNSKFNNNFQ